MAVNVTKVVAELEAIATVLDSYGAQALALVPGCTFEGGDVIFATTLGPCKVKLRMDPTAEGVRARAEHLKAQARKWAGGTTESYDECRRASSWRPKRKQAKRCGAVFIQFLKDGEEQNAAEYEKLFI